MPRLVQNGSDDSARADAGRIALAIADAIRAGAWRAGERLPPERGLAVTYGGARGTIRAALDRLERQGLITRRVGSGTFVAAVSRGRDPESDVADLTSPQELLEARRAVEPHLVRLAVRKATPRDIELLDEALKRLEACGGDVTAFGDGDLLFHERLAAATHNPLMLALFRQVNRVRGHAHWRDIQRKTLTRARLDDYHRQHRALFQAIAARDAEAAERLTIAHLDEAERDLMNR
ncbi:MAG: FadR family transcriptional regulator [Alphaproteobacteria bacterium]|nr:FadR family transcriptional regulator [Alphaproteobacteria bacterium]